MHSHLQQECLFKGPTWNYLCLAVELPNRGDTIATTIGEAAVYPQRERRLGNRCCAMMNAMLPTCTVVAPNKAMST
jgi:hypothetical protein